MKIKLFLLLIAAALAVSLSACGTPISSSTEVIPDTTDTVSEALDTDYSDESAVTDPSETEAPEETTSAEVSAPTELPSEKETADTTTSAQRSQPTQSQQNSQEQQDIPSEEPVESSMSDSMESSSSETNDGSTPDTNSSTTIDAPFSSESLTTTEPEQQLSPEGVLYSDFEDDGHGILKEIHEYAVSKGFVPDDTLNMDAGYRGRPNLTDLSVSSVKSTLKYHVDMIYSLYGPAHFRVVFWNYQGKIEYIFLWC